MREGVPQRGARRLMKITLRGSGDRSVEVVYGNAVVM
jgi:hypothetical protein